MNEFDKQFSLVEDLHFSGSQKEAYTKCLIFAENGNPKCMRFLGWYFYKDELIPVDLDKSRGWFKSAADLDDIEAVYGMASVAYCKGAYEEALNLFLKSWEMEFYPSLYRIGLMYQFGLGHKKDDDLAFDFFDKSSALGSIYGLRSKASMLMRGYSGIIGRVIGFYLTIKAIASGFKIALTDPDDRRLMH